MGTKMLVQPAPPKRKFLSLLLIITILFLSVKSNFDCSQKAENISNKYIKLKEHILFIEIPSIWHRMNETEIKKFRKQYTQASEQIFHQYYGTTEGSEWGVPYLVGFFAPNMEAFFVAIVIRIPRQAKDYLDQQYKSSEKKFQWGMKQGIIKKVFSNRKKEINGMPALEMDVEMGNRSRTLSYIFYFSDHPDFVINLNINCDPGIYDELKSDFKHIIDSFRITFPIKKDKK